MVSSELSYKAGQGISSCSMCEVNLTNQSYVITEEHKIYCIIYSTATISSDSSMSSNVSTTTGTCISHKYKQLNSGNNTGHMMQTIDIYSGLSIGDKITCSITYDGNTKLPIIAVIAFD